MIYRIITAVQKLKQMEKDGSVFVIRPSKPVTISRIEKNIDKLRALYEEGYQDAKTQWDDLQKFLHHAE